MVPWFAVSVWPCVAAPAIVGAPVAAVLAVFATPLTRNCMTTESEDQAPLELQPRLYELSAMLQPDAAPASSPSESVVAMPSVEARISPPPPVTSSKNQYWVFAARSRPWPDAAKV